MPQQIPCVICGKLMRTSATRPRKACSADCRKVLGAQAGKRWREAKAEPTAEQIAAATRCAIKLRAISAVPASVPRRKCPTCGRAVRLTKSVAGAVWLRSHYSWNGLECEGSMFIVSYPMEKEVASDD